MTGTVFGLREPLFILAECDPLERAITNSDISKLLVLEFFFDPLATSMANGIVERLALSKNAALVPLTYLAISSQLFQRFLIQRMEDGRGDISTTNFV